MDVVSIVETHEVLDFLNSFEIASPCELFLR
jgi:hypothetical protein